LMRDYLGGTRDSVLLEALRDLQSFVKVADSDRVPYMGQSLWTQ
jgi:hypothetical protein